MNHVNNPRINVMPGIIVNWNTYENNPKKFMKKIVKKRLTPKIRSGLKLKDRNCLK